MMSGWGVQAPISVDVPLMRLWHGHMPDGRMSSEKIVLRSRKIRVQDFHTNPCENHVHTNHCGVRRISYTGLGEIIQNIAWELDVQRVIAENNFGEENQPKKCACAVRLNLESLQPRHSSPPLVRGFAHVSAEVHQGQPRITCVAKVMIHEVSSDYPIGDKLCQGRQVDIIDGSHTLIDVSYPCVSPAYGCVAASGHCPGPTSMAASSSMATADESSVFVVKKGKDGPECQHFVRMVNNPSDHSPTYKISKELFQIPHKMAEISKLSAALKQLCMYLKYNNMQGRKLG